jgi:alpha-glucoside transport system substrate-binding protein
VHRPVTRPEHHWSGVVMVGVLAALTISSVACGRGERGARPSVEIFGPYTDRDATAFTEALRPFEERTGIDVRYIGSVAFADDLTVRAQRGNPPDLAVIPQPALLRELVTLGVVQPYEGDLEQSVLDNVDSRLVSMLQVDGRLYGSWYRVSLKSLVWYSPRAFAARGLEPPRTWSELLALSNEIAATGVEPWCLGVRDGRATGWVATDWVEDLLLREAGLDVYDDWVDHDVPFTDPRVASAVESFGKIARSDRLVLGGPGAAVQLTVQEAAVPLLGSDPSCLLHRQASFLPDLLADDVDIAPGSDLWAFPLPGLTPDPPPLLVGGDLIARFSNEPEALALAEYLSTPEAATSWARRGGFVSALSTFESSSYEGDLERTISQWLSEAPALRFDGSDLMPTEVGSGAFWSGMTAWLGGARLEPMLASIDGAWPVEATPLLSAGRPEQSTDR